MKMVVGRMEGESSSSAILGGRGREEYLEVEEMEVET